MSKWTKKEILLTLAAPFLFTYLMALTFLAAAVNVLALFVCAPYIIIKGTQPKWLDKLEEYFGICP